MLHKGMPVTFAQALPSLLKLRRTIEKVRVVHRCKCTDGPCLNRPRATVADLDWSVCPYGLLRSPYMGLVEAVHGLAQVSPLSGWPDDFPAWLVAGVLQLHRDMPLPVQPVVVVGPSKAGAR